MASIERLQWAGLNYVVAILESQRAQFDYCRNAALLMQYYRCSNIDAPVVETSLPGYNRTSLEELQAVTVEVGDDLRTVVPQTLMAILPDYAAGIPEDCRARYKEKLSLIGKIDPYELPKAATVSIFGLQQLTFI